MNSTIANSSFLKLPELWMRIRLVVVRPQGHGLNNPVTEAMDGLRYAFTELGSTVDIAHNEFILDGINILFFSFFITAQDVIPPNTIVFNVDQIDEGSIVLPKDYIEQLNRFVIWDYSLRNIKRIQSKISTVRIQHVEIGYAPILTRIREVETQDIDVLFYGALNARRKNILDKLVELGFKVIFFDTAYGEERDNYIARAKVVLNVHYYEAKIFEIFRVSYLLANSKAVVSECGDGTEMDGELREAVVAVEYDEIVDACARLISDDKSRKEIEKRGFSIFQRRNQTQILQNIILASPYTARLPKSINLGSRKSWNRAALNIDISTIWDPDVLFDASRSELFSTMFSMDRFGTQKIPSSYFEKIVAMDVLENVPDLIALMTNCLQLLCVGGEMHIGVPYDLSHGAWQDPTHIRAFNEKSWLYYTDWHWYIGWRDARFDLVKFDFVYSELGQSMINAGSNLPEVIRAPRAVDSMNVVLRKRMLTAEEVAHAIHLHKGNRQILA